MIKEIVFQIYDIKQSGYIYKRDLFEWIKDDNYSILIGDIVDIFKIIYQKSVDQYKNLFFGFNYKILKMIKLENIMEINYGNMSRGLKLD